MKKFTICSVFTLIFYKVFTYFLFVVIKFMFVMSLLVLVFVIVRFLFLGLCYNNSMCKFTMISKFTLSFKKIYTKSSFLGFSSIVMLLIICFFFSLIFKLFILSFLFICVYTLIIRRTLIEA